MPLSDRKVTTILLEECDNLPERCTGYRHAVRDTITDILLYERQHLTVKTNIQQKVDQECDSAAELLVRDSGVPTAKE